MTFVPFDATEDEIAQRQVLRPGVPVSMRKPLITWIWRDMQSDRYVRPTQLHDLENNLDVSFGLNPSFTGLINEAEFRNIIDKLEDRELLRVADLLLFKAGRYGRGHYSLGEVLAEGRSQYEVVEREGSHRLAPRLPEGVQDAAEAVGATSDTPGLLLRRSWSKLYDLQPDDSGAYAAAVKAVEAAALPALGITKETATISDAVRALEKRDATWRLPFKREHTEYPSRDVLLGMLKSLYRGQRDRHGSDSYSDVSHDEAEAAVLMAVALVGWFSRSLVKERDIDSFG